MSSPAPIGASSLIDTAAPISPTGSSPLRIASRWPRLLTIGVALLLFNAAAAVLAIQERWPAAFGVTPDPDRVAEQALIGGTAISAPVAPLIALIVFVVLVRLRTRRTQVVGYIGTIVVGALFVIGTFGEPTLLRPESALEFAFHVLGLALALTLLVTAVRGLAGLRAGR